MWAQGMVDAVAAAGLDDWQKWDDLEEVREFRAYRFGLSTLDYVTAAFAVRCGRGHEWMPGKPLPPAHPRRYRRRPPW